VLGTIWRGSKEDPDTKTIRDSATLSRVSECRAAVAAATRWWRQRQAKGIRLVTIEVSEAKLAQLVADSLVPEAALEEPISLGKFLGRLRP
jgi:hypothetical protein